ncbi:exosome RNA helicase MTR4-like [Schistocerca gregaria]|uniref:exosome RNA helicase MTR4-like n=1 Tax=Schistocerca gregaria TaxID=7010 RepID=UPI00211DBFAE|nr:exosome RNA helicase MTR4-like [Schistocerca gregaria]
MTQGGGHLRLDGFGQTSMFFELNKMSGSNEETMQDGICENEQEQSMKKLKKECVDGSDECQSLSPYKKETPVKVEKISKAIVSDSSTMSYFDVLPSDMAETKPSPRAKSPNLFKDVKDNVPIAEELLEERKKCQHEMCVPPGWQGDPWDENTPANPNRKAAKEFSFSLDPFQRVAIACLERNESVLVSAHTSAGKTVVAQYAIAMALRDGQRVIYTSPIKALSNQKYRDLHDEFKDVGLMTGDISINSDASCLVMTTEILRSMLYRGSELLREVGWIIYDEVHYMRDKERGVVWEETLIMLSRTVRFVFLSATIPNSREFASWIATLHSQPCHVVYTDFRPIPLQHYIYPAGSTSLHLVVNERGQFIEDNFQRALANLISDGSSSEQKRRNLPDNVIQIVKVIMERNYEPVIVFAFSKKSCETLATKINRNFNSKEEQEMVNTIFSSAIDTLPEEDKALPQVRSILPLLQRGIGIHHSGLLPLLKEVIEILFQEGLIKCLFATETFSIGLNMPAKTVVFTSVRKFDGDDFRWISSGEYIQMSGRSGRRGIDDRGIVVMIVDEKMDPSVIKNIVKGQADTLTSSFYIGYNMLLNTLRVETLNPEMMLRSSFHNFQHNRHLPELRRKIEELERQYREIQIENEEMLSQFYQLNQQASIIREYINQKITQPDYILPFLQPGRLVRVRDGETKWGWGVTINYQKASSDSFSGLRKSSDLKRDSNQKSASYVVDVLLACSPGVDYKSPDVLPRPAQEGETPDPLILPVLLGLIDGISQVKIRLPHDLRQKSHRESVWKLVKEVHRRFPDGIPLLDPVEDMEIAEDEFIDNLNRLERIERALLDNPLFRRRSTDPEVDKQYQLYLDKIKLGAQIKELKEKAYDSNQIVLQDELKSMMRVLRRLGYTTKDNIVETKGRVACEINAADELVLTELIFSGFFNSLNIPMVAAMLSCFIFQDKTEGTKKVPEAIAVHFNKLLEVVRKIGQIEQECKLPTDPEKYVSKFKPTLAEVFYEWAKGSRFIDVCKLTAVFEGSIIRAMRRLEELLRQLVNASKSIGNTELETKFSETILTIKRGIVFTASLYL